MKKNKKTIILLSVIILVVIAIIAIIILNNKKTIKENKTSYLTVNSVMQSEIDNEIKNNLEKNKYTLNNAGIYINPYNTSPLSAMITFYTDSEETVEVIIKGKNNNDIKLDYNEKNKYHYIPIFGLYANEETDVILNLSNGKSKTFKIKTNKIEAKDIKSNIETEEKEIYFITSPLSMNTMGIDAYGKLRWYSEDFYHNVIVLENGHLLVGTNTMNNNGLSTDLLEIDYLGRVYNRYSIESGYLNDFFVKDNGNIIVSSKKEGRATYSDLIIEIDKNTGEIVKTVDIYELFSNIDYSFTNGLDNAYFNNSGIEYYENTDTLLLTYWAGEFVISLDYSDSSINWIFSNPENFTSSFSNYLLVSTDGTYPESMYSATLNDNVLKVFDNGYPINSGITAISSLKGSYSSANTYEIINNNITLKNSLNENKKYFSYALGDYEINNDSEIVLFGRELNNVNYEDSIDINSYNDLYSKMIEYKDNKKVVELTFKGGSSSVTKINLNKQYNFEFIEEKVLTSINITPSIPLTEDVINLVRNTNEVIDYTFTISNNVIENNVLFMDDIEAKLVLIDSNNFGAIYTLKNIGEEKIEKISPNITTGRYEIFVIENNTSYKTNQFIDIK